MNFKKLQAMQKELDSAILNDKSEMTAEERFEKTCVALSVELAEVANCAERFKFWKNGKGKVDEKRFEEMDVPEYMRGKVEIKYWDNNKNTCILFEQAHKLTLIEEASDCLHFILSLANQSCVAIEIDKIVLSDFKQYVNNNEKYIELNHLVYDTFSEKRFNSCLVELFIVYLESLDITQNELEQAYYDKHKINYDRLEDGY